MSILANLLKKAETSQSAGGEIPPGLLQTVRSPAGRDTGQQRKYLLLGLLAVTAVAAGGLLALYLEGRPSQRPGARQPVPVQTTAVAVQRQMSAVPPAPAPPAAAVARQEPPGRPAAATSSASRTSAVSSTATARRQTRAAVGSSRRSAAAAATEQAQPSTAERKPEAKDKATIDALLFAARSAEGRRDYAAALRQYQRALEADPHNYRIMNNVASTMLHLGMDEQALVAANRALAVKPDYPSAMVNAGIALARTGHDRAARELYRKALVLEPANQHVLYHLALSQERAGMAEESLQLYRRLAEAGDPRGLLGQGRLHERAGNRGEALRCYRDVLRLPEAGQGLKEAARERVRVLEQP